ncbi:MAG: hypothetical protein H7Z37_06160 [Pyrinomonadaceae bacterium]|nr:hypothetical protein [Pyrinomonadaceae bacterium]
MFDNENAFDETNEKVERRFVFALTVWGIVVATLGYLKIFQLFPLPLIAVFAAAGITIPVVIYFTNSAFRNYVASISYKHLTIFNIWRIPAGAIFLYYGSYNLLPQQFVINAGYGDLIIGFIVPIVLMMPESRWKYVVFHVFGMLDFIVAVGTGITFTILQVPLQENIATFPVVLIPLFGVGITGAFHIMTLNRLWHERSFSLNLPNGINDSTMGFKG